MSTLVFYGHFRGYWSYSYVCRELVRYLVDNGVDLYLCSLDQDDLPDEELYQDISGAKLVDHEIRSFVRGGVAAGASGAGLETMTRHHKLVDADGTSLVFSRPGNALAAPRHQRRVGYFVVDSHKCPGPWADAISRGSDTVLTPSRWSARALHYAVSGAKPLYIVPHGVASAFRPGGAVPDEACPDYRFFCSSQNGRRKGLPELLEAIDILVEAGEFDTSGLTVHTPWVEVQAAVAERPWGHEVEFVEDQVGSPREMSDVLKATRKAILAPSRAEGFGLIPLEALCCGVPVVAPSSTGHAEYLELTTPGLVHVPTGKMQRYDQVGLDEGKAPSILPDLLASCIRAVDQHWQDYRDEALEYSPVRAEEHAWPVVLDSAKLLDILGLR